MGTRRSFLLNENFLLDPLWETGDWVSFPLFPWLAYSLLGLALAGFVLVWLASLSWLDRRLSWRLVPRYLTSLSRTITAVYLIQWIIIGWVAITLGVFDQPSWLAALLGVPILIASHLLALL